MEESMMVNTADYGCHNIMALCITIFGVGIMGFAGFLPSHEVIGFVIALVGVVLAIIGK